MQLNLQTTRLFCSLFSASIRSREVKEHKDEKCTDVVDHASCKLFSTSIVSMHLHLAVNHLHEYFWTCINKISADLSSFHKCILISTLSIFLKRSDSWRCFCVFLYFLNAAGCQCFARFRSYFSHLSIWLPCHKLTKVSIALNNLKTE